MNTIEYMELVSFKFKVPLHPLIPFQLTVSFFPTGHHFIERIFGRRPWMLPGPSLLGHQTCQRNGATASFVKPFPMLGESFGPTED